MRSKTRMRRLGVALGAGSLLVAGAVAAGAPGAAAAGPVFTVMNTSESPPDGVYFRNSPNWNDTSRTTGLGAYMNERVELQCYVFGQAIGPHSNQLWYWTPNVSRPTNNGAPNQGMLNAHYVNDGRVANEVVPGVPACVNNRPPVSPPPPPPPAPIGQRVAFYSGLDHAGSAEAAALRNPSIDRNLTADGTYDGRWTPATSCAPDSRAVSFAGKDINRLAGWSLGRLGPIYALKYMKDNNQAAARRVNYVIMFDPGRPENFGSCDYNQTTVQAGQTLGWWLSLSSDNRLIILAGSPTATNGHVTIQSAYFDSLRATYPGMRRQALVCNYSLSHEATYRNYAWLMTSASRLATTQGFGSCPKQGSASVWGWNP